MAVNRTVIYSPIGCVIFKRNSHPWDKVRVLLKPILQKAVNKWQFKFKPTIEFDLPIHCKHLSV